jgi:hypothetical protein
MQFVHCICPGPEPLHEGHQEQASGVEAVVQQEQRRHQENQVRGGKLLESAAACQTSGESNRKQ